MDQIHEEDMHKRLKKEQNKVQRLLKKIRSFHMYCLWSGQVGDLGRKYKRHLSPLPLLALLYNFSK